MDCPAQRNLFPYTEHGFLEEFPVFRIFDGFNRSSKDLNAVFFKDTHFCKFTGNIKACLTSNACNYPVRAFFFNNFFYDLCIKGLDID